MKFNRLGILTTLILSCVLSTAAIGQTDSGTKTKWGGTIVLKYPISLSEAVKNYKNIEKKEILILSNVQQVCQQKGCWMGVGEGDLKVRVTFKDYGFFVPTSLVGKKVMIQGVLEHTTMSVSDAQHYAKDAGKSAEEIKAIDKPVDEFRLIASAVELKG